MVAFAIAATACSSSDRPSSSAGTATAPTVVEASPSPATAGDSTLAPSGSAVTTSGPEAPQTTTLRRVLTEAGATVVDAPNPSALGAGLTLTTSQVQMMAEEAAVDAGLLGADLDAAGGGATSGLPMSAVLAGYVRGVDAPGARYARELLARQDLTHPQGVVFPTIVLALFAAEATSAFSTDEAAAATTTTAVVAGFGDRSTTLRLGLCSDVTKTIFDAVDKIFAKIHIPPGKVGNTGSSFLNGVLQGLTDVVVSGLNFIIDAAKTLIVDGIKFVLGQVLSIVAEVAAAAALVANFVSAVRPWTLQVTAREPNTKKGVGSDLVYDQATATAIILGPTDDWPAWFVDCASVAGVTLPSLLPVGAPVTWKVEPRVLSADLMAESVHEIQKDTELRKDGAAVIAKIGLVTGTESQEATRGEEQHGAVLITATARRRQIVELREALATGLRNIADRVLQAVPSAIREYLLGLVSEAANSGSEQLASLLDASASALIDVLYHGPPPPEAPPQTAGPTTSPVYDPCSVLSDAEVVQILGVPVARHERSAPESPFQGCIVGTERQPLGPTEGIYYISLSSGAGDFSMFHDDEETQAPTTPLAGLGDAAEYIDGAGMVAVNFGPNVLLVQVVIGGVPAPLDVVIHVAELILARLR